jgi:hypothetical protein
VAATAAGVVAHKSRFGVSDHPVCGAKVGFAEIFLMPQPPLLTRRGILSNYAIAASSIQLCFPLAEVYMKTVQLANAVTIVLLVAAHIQAQGALEPTRFTVAGAPILFQPKEDFGRNVSTSFGGGGALLYRLDRTGLLSVRFDLSGVAYGHEKRRVPLSESIGGRVLVDATTTNSMLVLSVGPELAMPRGIVRPYLNTGFSKLFFRTTSSVKPINESDNPIASTTNFSDSANAWFIGGGLRIPFGGRPALKAISLDIGARYYRGGLASYLQAGGIQDNPDGSISITPLTSRTPQVVYLIGMRYSIPYNTAKQCPRLIC